MEVKINSKEFVPFRDTYRLITFTLSVGMIYPNPDTDIFRILAITFIILTIAPMATMILIDMYFCWKVKDIINIIRHSTVVGPFLAGFLKMLLMYYKRKEAKQILDEIDRDYESYNYMPDDYKELNSRGIHNNLIYSERCWVMLVITCVMTFPLMAVIETVYSYAFTDIPVKFMIHDLKIQFCEPELRFASPQFEILFVYMFYCSLLYVVNFIGYDGFFGLSINHACMKMDIYCKSLEDALKGDEENMHEKIVKVIQEQCRMFEFVDLIQDTFNIWLGLIFLATMIQICTCLYHITESVETSSTIYCCGWENVYNQSIRKMIIFMIARAQIPIEITAFNMLAFDMELFLSIMQTSYSMFTLLKT